MLPERAAPALVRTISLTGAVALVVGGVVGAGIFVLVRDIAAKAGGAIWLAFLLAMLISLAGVVPLIQLAGVLPRAGGGYYFATRLLHPFAGVLTSYWILLGGCSSTAVVALTLALYLQEVLPGVPPHAAGLGLLALFYAVYCFGVRLAISLQVILSAQFVAALLIYGLGGLWHAAPAVTLWPPAGPAAFGEAVLLCYSTCMGFQVIAEMGEEIRDAPRNIPRALLLGGGVVAAIYILVGVVFVSAAPPDATGLASMRTPLNDSGALFLPTWLLPFLSLGAVTAALTSLNAAAIALPREIFAQARDGFLPPGLARVTPRTHSPQRAVTLFFLGVAVLLACGKDPDFYGYLAAIGILGVTAVISLGALALHRNHRPLYDAAYIRFPYALLLSCSLGTVLVCAALAAIMSVQRPAVVVVYALWTLLLAGVYPLRLRAVSPETRARMRTL